MDEVPISFPGVHPPDMIPVMALQEFTIEYGAAPGLAGGARLTISGPIDAKSVPAFRDEVEALRGRRIRYFLLEMGEVRYINSTGLAYLITMAETVREAGGAVALVNVQPKVQVIFETMGLLDFVRFYPSRAAAVRDLRPPSAAPVAPPAAKPAPHAPSAGKVRRLFRRLFGPPKSRHP